MALRVDYVVKEMATNLRRNLTLTFATMVTIALTLAFVGAVLLINQGVNRSNVQFKGNVQFIVFMDPAAAQPQIDAVGRQLSANPQIKSNTYLNHEQAYEEFKVLFANDPTLVENITPADLPTSYKVFLKDGSSTAVLSLTEEFRKAPGVKEVVAAAERIKKNEEGFSKIRVALLVGSGVIGIASMVLIVNSIRIAMFARRREIEVMKLVGATNWFIRVPFMAEGFVQGIVGSVVGIGIVSGLKGWLLPIFTDSGGLFTDFRLTSGDVTGTAIVLLIAGALVGVAGSAFAATRFLDV
ncbi:MAG: cell division transport system permease protein [Acidimicrobiaceae bacterium]